MNEEITPTLKKLNEERRNYLEFQKTERELEHNKKIWLAYTFTSAESASEKLEEDAKKVEQDLEDKHNSIESGKFFVLTNIFYYIDCVSIFENSDWNFINSDLSLALTSEHSQNVNTKLSKLLSLKICYVKLVRD